jgi:hypothetical protein
MSEAVTTINIQDFVRHFEFQLAKCLAIELGEINETISMMFHLLKAFRNDCTTKLISNKNDSKTAKIAENIDSILIQFGSYPPVLPYADFIDEFNHKIRKKMKNIENSGGGATGGKGNRNNSSVSATTPLSSTVKSFLSSLLAETDTLEGLKVKQLVTCQYLTEIRASVHTPLNSLLEKYGKLPTAPGESNEVSIATQAVETIEKQYNMIKNTPMFVKIVTYRVEAECIENKVSELLDPLRQAAVVIGQPASVQQQREIVWSRSLLPLLACPPGELLARCCHK